ncbi:hypothetical protein [Nesterenkonia suensis]
MRELLVARRWPWLTGVVVLGAANLWLADTGLLMPSIAPLAGMAAPAATLFPGVIAAAVLIPWCREGSVHERGAVRSRVGLEVLLLCGVLLTVLVAFVGAALLMDSHHLWAGARNWLMFFGLTLLALGLIDRRTAPALAVLGVVAISFFGPARRDSPLFWMLWSPEVGGTWITAAAICLLGVGVFAAGGRVTVLGPARKLADATRG